MNTTPEYNELLTMPISEVIKFINSQTRLGITEGKLIAGVQYYTLHRGYDTVAENVSEEVARGFATGVWTCC